MSPTILDEQGVIEPGSTSQCALRSIDSNTVEAAMLRLRILSPDATETTRTLTTDFYTLGRSPDADIQLNSPQVSRHHARIQQRNGDYWLEDVGSINQTFIGGGPIAQPTRLQPGTTLTIGDFRIAIEHETIDNQEAASPTPAPATTSNGIFNLGMVILAMLVIIAISVYTVSPLNLFQNRNNRSSLQMVERYEAIISKHMMDAQRAFAEQQWIQTHQSLNEVLSRDPINPDALRLKRAYDDLKQARSLLAQAQTALKQQQTLLALELLSSIPKNLPANSPLKSRIDLWQTKAQQDLLNTRTPQIEQACENEKWMDCHQKAIQVLRHIPTAETPIKLLTKSEKAMDQAGMLYVPWHIHRLRP